MKSKKPIEELKFQPKRNKNNNKYKNDTLINILRSYSEFEPLSYQEILFIRYLLNKYIDLILAAKLKESKMK